MIYLLAAVVLAAVPAPAVTLPVPDDAAKMAAADARQLVAKIGPADMVFQRYVWMVDGEAEDVKVLAKVLNEIGRSDVIARPDPLYGGKLVRIDLRQFAPKLNDLNDWLRIWEELRYDPSFSLLVTKGTIKLLAEGATTRVRKTVKVPGKVLKTVEPYVAVDGKTYDWKWVDGEKDEVQWVEVSVKKAAGVDVIRADSPAVDPRAWSMLRELLSTEAPVVDHRYFLARATASIRDKGPYRTIFGGLYYDFAGIVRDPKQGTAEDALYESLGLGRVADGFTAQKLFDKLRSDQRIAVFRSKVTGKPRRADVFPIPAVREYEAILSVTHDAGDADIDPTQHPILNLIEFEDKAREVIWVRANGTHGKALFDNKGALQDEVPPDVAKDHTIRAPFTGRLQAQISCIRCHEAEGSEGWKPLVNDVRRMLTGHTDVFGDLSLADDPAEDAVTRIAGLYAGDPERRLRRGRDDLSEVVLRITGPWKGGNGKQTDVVMLAAKRLVQTIDRYQLDEVDARGFLRELGYDVKAEDAVATLKAILPPDPSGRVGRVVPVDPRVGALQVGLSVNRVDCALVYSFAAARAKARAAMQEGGKK